MSIDKKPKKASKRMNIEAELKNVDTSNYINLTNFNSLLSGGQPIISSLAGVLDDPNRISSFLNPQFSPEVLQNSDATARLRKELNEAKDDKKKSDEIVRQLREELGNGHVLSRIQTEAHSVYFSSEDFKKEFLHGSDVDAVIVSIDIRRSTELMLKARTPNDYSQFITELSAALSSIIIENDGIFDKFTGDGILAFFPKFYSGESAILKAIKSAQLCHNAFSALYSKNKSRFSVFIKDVGLGIGIDYGRVSVVNTVSELTVVGGPVVYACRFSGADAGDTLLNQRAYELAVEQESKLVKDIIEKDLEIKHEGTALAYKVIVDLKAHLALKEPGWKQYKIENLEETNSIEE